MFFGRLMGWALVALALLLASGDAGLALGHGDALGIRGGNAWMVLGLVGVGMIRACRVRRQRIFFK